MRHLIKTQAFINGSWQDAHTGRTFPVTDPSGGGKLADVADAGADDTRAAVDAAAAAFPAWRDTLPAQRAAILRNWQRLVEENAAGLACLMTSEQGKPLAESRGEIAAGAAMLGWAAEEARRTYGHTIPPFKAGTAVMTVREPVGVVAAITPWNFPHSMITRKVAPAIAAGCTVVLKPAEDTPLSALALAHLAQQAGVPAGVFNVVPARDPVPVGDVLTTDARVRKLSFTGSTDVGRHLMAACAPTLKRVSLELGGNAPFMVFDDADIDAAVAGVMASKFRNAGQTCICANRIFVETGILERFTAALHAEIGRLRLGSGLDSDVTTGPVINAEALTKIESLVADACARGGSLVCGGKRSPLGGTFYEPTLLAGATAAMRLAKEEIFGPVAAIFPFTGESQAIDLANATEYGLAAYFYTRDLGRAWRVASALEYGMVGINEALLASESIPFGGIKHSGFGREGGPASLDDWTVEKYWLVGGLTQRQAG